MNAMLNYRGSRDDAESARCHMWVEFVVSFRPCSEFQFDQDKGPA